eukprot:gene6425-12989_t
MSGALENCQTEEQQSNMLHWMHFSIAWTLKQSRYSASHHSEILLRSTTTSSIATEISKGLHQKFLKDIYNEAKREKKNIQLAVSATETLLNENKITNPREAMTAISIFKLAGKIDAAVDILVYMETNKIRPDTFIYNNLIDGCARFRDWRRALSLLSSMTISNTPRDTISYSSAISACEKTGQWQEALRLLGQMADEGIPRDTICYSSVISACASGGQVKTALQLLQRMKVENVPLDTISMNSAISAAAKAGEMEVVVKLLRYMTAEGLPRDTYTYTTAISACEMTGKWQDAEALLEELLEDASGGKIASPGPAPFNAAISTFIRARELSRAKKLFYLMRKGSPLPHPNTITYTTLVSAYSREGLSEDIIELYDIMNSDGIQSNQAIFRCVLSSCEKLALWQLALQTLKNMQLTEISPGVLEYNSAIIACYKASKVHEVLSLLDEMKRNNLIPTLITYNTAISALKLSGAWEKAIELLNDMENDGIKPDTVSYSSVISVCVASKQWQLALESLERMEAKNIGRNIITYNSVIEALDAAGETVRAELVYQSALRAGIYSHWKPREMGQTHEDVDTFYKTNTVATTATTTSLKIEKIMDFHNFPVTVARAAIMHVLGEMCADILPVSDLVIITGRGNHVNKDGSRGVLRAELIPFLLKLNLSVSPSEMNPGRLLLTEDVVSRWLDIQKNNNNTASAHKNLFMQVAFAKQTRNPNLRAECPFSSAKAISIQTPPYVVSEMKDLNSNLNVKNSIGVNTIVDNNVGVGNGDGVGDNVCSHQSSLVNNQQTSSIHAVDVDVEADVKVKSGGCPFHKPPQIS